MWHLYHQPHSCSTLPNSTLGHWTYFGAYLGALKLPWRYIYTGWEGAQFIIAPSLHQP